MHTVRLITLLIVAVATGTALCAQDDDVRERANVLTQRSDSLRRVWDVMWKRSDSLRIESMLIRMRSDSLRRAANAMLAQKPDTAAAPDAEIISSLANRVRTGSVRSGQTLSDSATRSVLRVEPDTGIASYYAEQFHGKKTSSGEPYDMHDRTCAHRWLPYNTRVRVTNLANNRSVVVRVNDRGPFKHTRLIDVSKGAAKELDMIRSGTARVVIEVVNDEE